MPLLQIAMGIVQEKEEVISISFNVQEDKNVQKESVVYKMVSSIQIKFMNRILISITIWLYVQLIGLTINLNLPTQEVKKHTQNVILFVLSNTLKDKPVTAQSEHGITMTHSIHKRDLELKFLIIDSPAQQHISKSILKGYKFVF